MLPEQKFCMESRRKDAKEHEYYKDTTQPVFSYLCSFAHSLRLASLPVMQGKFYGQELQIFYYKYCIFLIANIEDFLSGVWGS